MSNRYCFKNDKLKIYITAYTDRVFRITYGEAKSDSLIVTTMPENVLCNCEENDNAYIIKTHFSAVRIDKKILMSVFMLKTN